MTAIEAVYLNGVFKPLGDVKLLDNSRVRLQVQPIPNAELLKWWQEVSELREQLFKKYGYFPDSALDVAEDRRR